MLTRKRLLNSITEKLAHFKALVATQNSINYFDINVAAEDFFRLLLNVVYDYSLTNLNHNEMNAVAVDLGDKERRLAVQVTSQRTKTKVQKTIDKFAANGLSEDYDSIKILIIGDHTGDYPTLKLPDSVAFHGKTDVIDIKRLTKKIATLDVEKLQKIADLINQQIDPIESSEAGNSTSRSYHSPILIQGYQLEDRRRNLSYVVVTVQNIAESNFPPYFLGLRNERGVLYQGAFTCDKTGELLPTQKREHKFLVKGNAATDGFLFDAEPDAITLVVQLEDSEKVLFESKLMGKALTEAHQILNRDGAIKIKDPVWWRMSSQISEAP